MRYEYRLTFYIYVNNNFYIQLYAQFTQPAHQLISDSTKPKPQVQRKRTKTSPLIRPVKKNGKAGRKKKIITAAQSNMMIPAHRPTMVIHPSDIQKNPVNKNVSTTNIQMKQENNTIHNHHESNQFIHHNSGNLLASSQSSYGSLSGSGNEDLYLKQDLMKGICENNYESSEDTGVSGLSENELISHDVIGNFDIESCAELSKVLSSLPSNTLDDLLTGLYYDDFNLEIINYVNLTFRATSYIE